MKTTSFDARAITQPGGMYKSINDGLLQAMMAWLQHKDKERQGERDLRRDDRAAARQAILDQRTAGKEQDALQQRMAALELAKAGAVDRRIARYLSVAGALKAGTLLPEQAVGLGFDPGQAEKLWGAGEAERSATMGLRQGEAARRAEASQRAGERAGAKGAPGAPGAPGAAGRPGAAGEARKPPKTLADSWGELSDLMERGLSEGWLEMPGAAPDAALADPDAEEGLDLEGPAGDPTDMEGALPDGGQPEPMNAPGVLPPSAAPTAEMRRWLATMPPRRPAGRRTWGVQAPGVVAHDQARDAQAAEWATARVFGS